LSGSPKCGRRHNVTPNVLLDGGSQRLTVGALGQVAAVRTEFESHASPGLRLVVTWSGDLDGDGDEDGVVDFLDIGVQDASAFGVWLRCGDAFVDVRVAYARELNVVRHGRRRSLEEVRDRRLDNGRTEDIRWVREVFQVPIPLIAWDRRRVNRRR
jgi:hypothetical protein